MNQTVNYTPAEREELVGLYNGLREKADFDSFLLAAHRFVTKLGIAPDNFRMALTKGAAMMELGNRAVFQYKEVKNGVEVGLLLDRGILKSLEGGLIKKVFPFSPEPIDFVVIAVGDWKAIPAELWALNEKAIATDYERTKHTRLAYQRLEDGTTNRALHYAVVTSTAPVQLPPGDENATNVAYFTAVDLDLLAEYGGTKYVKTDDAQKKVREDLKALYKKVDHWAQAAQRSAFPGRRPVLRRDPRNQGGHFEEYQWAKIYPAANSPEQLAFTVSVENGEVFTIKIDTAKLYDSDPLRQRYLSYRGEYDASPIVKNIPRAEGLALGWSGLLKITLDFLKEKLPAYNELVALLFPPSAATQQPCVPVNVIYYGPPGTGKTYGIFRRAVCLVEEIAEEESMAQYPTQAEVSKAFRDQLIKDWNDEAGQVAFVTFHQAFAYEDFVEGLKPRTEKDKKVTYAIEPGIFKRLVQRAKENWLGATRNAQEPPFTELFALLEDQWSANKTLKFAMTRLGAEFTITELGDPTIYFRKANGSERHTLSVSTLRDFYYGQRELGADGLHIYYRSILEKLRSLAPPAAPSIPLQQYVLVIDELNRANISAVLGELITLLESDKRLGAENPLEVMLPYSKELFGVPPNLHIIGTMNTSDRSVEALDMALRRRFSFVECPSKPVELEMLAYRMVGEVDLSKLLTVINARIEMLLDRDHHIGHSYFMNWSDTDPETKLRQVFKNNIIPLLQEYFYGDPVKIGLVLGDGFVKELKSKEEGKVEFAEAYRKAIDIEPKPRYIFQDVMDRVAVPLKEFKAICDGK